MKLFQQLLVAPAALGLLATGVNAAELNINGVSDYASSADQVTSVTQFSDVYPTDWAYQALAGLVETYGCVAGYPNGTFRGNRAMTRFEAAALLNACLDRVTEVTDELRRLMAEFETELAILKGRVDGLEAKVGELEATQFSTTTKLKGVTYWNVGAIDNDNKTTNGEALTVNYDIRLALKTSFTGEDMLTTVLRSGNFNDQNAFSGIAGLEYGFAPSADNNVQIGRLFYTFPVGDSLTVTAGPVVRTDDPGMYAGYATFYPADLLLDFFTYGGAWATNNLSGQGSGVGAVYEIGDTGFSVSGNYVAFDGDSSTGGIGTDQSNSTSTWQLFYSGEAFGGNLLAQAGYAVEDGTANANTGFGTASAQDAMTGGGTGYSLAAAWKPADSGLIPSISTGISTFDPTTKGKEDVDGWYVGFEWSDVFVEGNSFGYAIGSAPNTGEDDENVLWEMYYSIPVTDNITVTPAIFGIDAESPLAAEADPEGFGGLVKTTFKF